MKGVALARTPMQKRTALAALYLAVGGAFAASLTATGLLLAIPTLFVGALLFGGVGSVDGHVADDVRGRHPS